MIKTGFIIYHFIFWMNSCIGFHCTLLSKHFTVNQLNSLHKHPQARLIISPLLFLSCLSRRIYGKRTLDILHCYFQHLTKRTQSERVDKQLMINLLHSQMSVFSEEQCYTLKYFLMGRDVLMSSLTTSHCQLQPPASCAVLTLQTIACVQ